jgi:hypothetical protein
LNFIVAALFLSLNLSNVFTVWLHAWSITEPQRKKRGHALIIRGPRDSTFKQSQGMNKDTNQLENIVVAAVCAFVWLWKSMLFKHVEG